MVKVTGNKAPLPYLATDIIYAGDCCIKLKGCVRAHYPEFFDKTYSVLGFNFVTSKVLPKAFSVSYWDDGEVLSLHSSRIFSEDKLLD